MSDKFVKFLVFYMMVFWDVLCFVTVRGAGRCRCLIRQSSTVANDSVLFIAVTAAGRMGGLSALGFSCWISVTGHFCSGSQQKK